jgi:hypothetical protein
MNPWIIQQLAAEHRAGYLAAAERWRAARPARTGVEARSRGRGRVSGLTRIRRSRRTTRLIHAEPIVSKASC